MFYFIWLPNFSLLIRRAHTQTLSPGARSSRIFALENMLKTSSKTLVDMASQLSAAAESEGNFNGKGRWNGVRSLPDAKSLLNFLFELVSSSRCFLYLTIFVELLSFAGIFYCLGT